jgi:hypothetical protein
MSSDADKFWEDVAGKLRKKKGLCPLTPEEAERAYNEAPEIPLSPELINSMVESITSGKQASLEPDPEEEWDDDPAFAEVDEQALAVYRNQGEEDPETKQAEADLEEELLSDDEPEEDQNC